MVVGNLGCCSHALGLLPSFWGGPSRQWWMFPVTYPQGWKWHSPSCFWLGEDRVPYSDARKTCSDYSSTLVTITNRSVPCQWWWVYPKTSPARWGVTSKDWSIMGGSVSRLTALPTLTVPSGSSRHM